MQSCTYCGDCRGSARRIPNVHGTARTRSDRSLRCSLRREAAKRRSNKSLTSVALLSTPTHAFVRAAVVLVRGYRAGASSLAAQCGAQRPHQSQKTLLTCPRGEDVDRRDQSVATPF